MKKAFSLLLFVIASTPLLAQQYNLYNSRTLYDVFENPSQSAYQIDTSRRFAFNFLIPTITINTTFSGEGEAAFKSLIYDGVFNGSDISIGNNRPHNRLALNTNNYLAMFRMLKSVKKNREIGLSWQIRNDLRVRATNETFALFDDFDLFTESSYENIVNDYLENQSYHQFGFSYRENLTKRLSVGGKVSLLSGVSYNELKVFRSQLNLYPLADAIDVTVAGRMRANYMLDNFEGSMLIPSFKHPGLAITASAGYKFRQGWSAFGNLKDLGFIRWGKSSYLYNFDTGQIRIDQASNSTSDNRLSDELDRRISQSRANSSFVSAINGKLEILVNKNLGSYQPNFILSKSLFNNAGNAVVVNNYHIKNYVFSLSGAYNTNKLLQIGSQFMIKSPNTEFFIGSDQLFKTVEMIRGFSGSSAPYDAGYSGASFYMGFGLKFGRVLEHPANANNIPGFEQFGNDKQKRGILKNIFKKKSKETF